MAIDLITGEHICMGLSLGSGCESCRKKHPHLIPKSQEEIDANRRNLEAAIAAYTSVLEGGAPITPAVVEDLNRFNYAGDNANRFEMLEELRTASHTPTTLTSPRRLAPVVRSKRVPKWLARFGAALSRLRA